MSGSVVDVGQPPRLGAVGQVAVGQQDHRRAVLEGDAGRLDGDVEAVRRAVRRPRSAAATRRGGRTWPAAGRPLGLGGQAGGRAAPLDVDDQQRQLEADGQADRLGLEVDARAAGGGDAEVAAEGGAEGGADAGDLVLGLQGAHAEVLVLGQLVEDVGRRRDRVDAEEQRQARPAGRRRRGPTPARCCR